MRNLSALCAIALSIFIGCSSSTQRVSPRDGDPDVTGDALGVTFACLGGGTDAAANDAGADPSPTCMSGQTFCHLEVYNSGMVAPSCQPFVDTPRAADCSGSPNCACLCDNALFFHCQTECRCYEDGGQVTVTCQQI